MTNPPRLTDRSALAARRRRIAPDADQFLHAEAADEVQERLSEVNKSFTAPLLIGAHSRPFRALFPRSLVIEDVDRLNVTPRAHDLVVHAMALHWADDPVGQLVQSRLALRPDGLFIAVAFGGQTLHELRSALAAAETEISGGLSPRVLPMADLRDTGALLQRAGFALPVADARRMTVRFPTLKALAADLRAMGETNALAARNKTIPPRRLFARTEAIYRESFGDADGYLPASFELVFLTGWAPDESQQKPLRPGSASARLADALRVEERPAGDQVAPKPR
ncbi:MAG: SAM-dependent methyltransferase [Paracoccaceae bacterium]|nr:SAM-dependent methyltransferase [Paracoccaceae bacterium]